MKNIDYLAEVGNGKVRMCAIAGLGLCTVSFAALDLMAIILLIGGHAPADVQRSLWVGLALFSLLLAASGWLMWRLLRRARSATGITMMPIWFIEAFGILFGAGLVFTLWSGHVRWLIVEAAAIALAMITVRRRLRRHPAVEGGREDAPPESFSGR